MLITQNQEAILNKQLQYGLIGTNNRLCYAILMQICSTLRQHDIRSKSIREICIILFTANCCKTMHQVKD